MVLVRRQCFSALSLSKVLIFSTMMEGQSRGEYVPDSVLNPAEPVTINKDRQQTANALEPAEPVRVLTDEEHKKGVWTKVGGEEDVVIPDVDQPTEEQIAAK